MYSIENTCTEQPALILQSLVQKGPQSNLTPPTTTSIFSPSPRLQADEEIKNLTQSILSQQMPQRAETCALISASVPISSPPPTCNSTAPFPHASSDSQMQSKSPHLLPFFGMTVEQMTKNNVTDNAISTRLSSVLEGKIDGRLLSEKDKTFCWTCLEVLKKVHEPYVLAKQLTIRNNDYDSNKLVGHTFTKSFMSFIVTAFPNVESMEIGSATFERGALCELQKLNKLKKLYIKYSSLSNIDFYSIRLLTALTTLNLTGTNVENKDLMFLVGLANLNSLYLDETNVTLGKIFSHPSVQNLSLLSLSSSTIMPESLSYLADLNKLRQLDISFTNVDDRGIAFLEKLMSLEELTLYKTSITDSAIPSLQKLSKLIYLNVENTKMKSPELIYQALQSWKYLRHITLNNYGPNGPQPSLTEEQKKQLQIW